MKIIDIKHVEHLEICHKMRPPPPADVIWLTMIVQ